MERDHELLKRIGDMIEGRAQEVLPQLCERIEETRGEIPQKVTIDVAFKPAKDEDSMARIEVSAKLSAKTTLSTALARVDIGDAGNQLTLFG